EKPFSVREQSWLESDPQTVEGVVIHKGEIHAITVEGAVATVDFFGFARAFDKWLGSVGVDRGKLSAGQLAELEAAYRARQEKQMIESSRGLIPVAGLTPRTVAISTFLKSSGATPEEVELERMRRERDDLMPKIDADTRMRILRDVSRHSEWDQLE